MLDLLKISPDTVRAWLEELIDSGQGRDIVFDVITNNPDGNERMTSECAGNDECVDLALRLIEYHGPEWMESRIKTHHKYHTVDTAQRRTK